jgi:hypothetical protein
MNAFVADRIARRLPVVLILLLLVAVAPPSDAVTRNRYSMEILLDGVPLEELAARGTAYVEALEGREYSIRLRNRTGERIAVALSVDGLNTIDAKSGSARSASKWILGPYQTITLDGWQTSGATARRFFFTTEERSYGAWLGRTENLGVITAAVFRERRPRPAPVWKRETRREGGAPPSAHERSRSKAAGCDALGEAESALSDEMAATGIGRELDHRVRRVSFDAESHPAAVLQVRYEYRDALVRLGVLPEPYARRDDALRRRERARGFDDMEFAPDPFRPNR